MAMLHQAAEDPIVSLKIRVRLVNALPIKATMTRIIKPEYANLTYSLNYKGDAIKWVCQHVEFHGPNLRKTKGGGLEIGQSRHEVHVFGTYLDDPWEDLNTHQRWAKMLAAAYRPEGFPIIDPMRYIEADIAKLHPMYEGGTS